MKSISPIIPLIILVAVAINLSANNQSRSSAEEQFVHSKVDVKPSLTFQVPPRYPNELKKIKVNGKVILSFVINEDGGVSDIKVEEPFPEHYSFVESAIEAVSQWKFSPGIKNGEVVKVRMRVPLAFRVDINADETIESAKEFLEQLERSAKNLHEYYPIAVYARRELEMILQIESEEEAKAARLYWIRHVSLMIKEKRIISKSEFDNRN